MRKKHQAIQISTIAKKNFCKELSLNNYTYEEEIKEQLSEYFNNNLRDEDIENIENNNDDNSDEDSFEVNNIIKIPKQDKNNNNEYAKFQISERAILNPIDEYSYELIPKKVINIGKTGKEKIDENNRDIGDNIKIEDIIKQYIFWKDNCDEKDKQNSEFEPFELFNLDEEKIKMIRQKIIDIKKIMKNKKMNEPMLNKLMKELEINYIQQRKELNNLVSKAEKIDSVTYGKNYSIVEYKK